MKNIWLVLLWLLISVPAGAQTGGKGTFTFLNLPANGQVAALGGINISAPESDAGSQLANPALLQKALHRHVAFSFTGYAADIAQNSLAYVFAPTARGAWGIALSYLDYGDFTGRNPAGLEEGKFGVHDYALSLTRSSTIGPFTLGASVKGAVSVLAEYRAVALLTDVGGLFRHPARDLTVALAFKNVGYQVRSFSGAAAAPLPFDLQAGVTFKPEHMPFRFSLTAQHLSRFDLVYLDTAANRISGRPLKKSVGQQIASHLVLGGELLLSKNFNLRLGYNHLRRRELGVEQSPGAAGFSFGTLIRVKGFRLDYAHGFYHQAGGSNHLTLSTDLGRFFKKKTVSETRDAGD